jgi:hypothetical protein
MFSKSILWSTVVAFLFFFFTPYLFYMASEACFQEYVRIDVSRSNTDFKLGHLALGVLLMSYAFVRLFQKWCGGIFSNHKGFVFGLWIALFASVAMGFIYYATQAAFKAPYYILDGIFWIGMYAVGGVLTAMVSRKTS